MVIRAAPSTDLVVEQPVAALQQQLQALFPGERIEVSTNEDATVLSGHVSSTSVMLRAAEIAKAAGTKRSVINMLQVPGGSESQQVLLQVRFAEVNRRALRELGVSLFTSGTGLWNSWGRTTTGQFPAPAFSDMKSTKVDGELTEQSGSLTFSDFLNVFFLNAKYSFGAVDPGARELRPLPEPRRAEPDCLQRAGGQLPRGR